MGRFVSVARFSLIALALTVALVAPAAASTTEDFLNAPVWYLEYEVSFTSSSAGSYDGWYGPMTFTNRLERVFSGSQKLNMRSPGPSPLSMTAGMGAGDGKPSMVEQQKMAMDMMAAMDYSANWMVGGAGMEEGATDEDIAADSKPASPFRVDYLRVDTGKGVIDEHNAKFDWTLTTTVKGTGMVLAGGFGAVMLEMNTKENWYALTLPLVFNDMGATLQRESVDIKQFQGKAPAEERKASDVPCGLFPAGLALDEEQKGGVSGGAMLRGTLDPSPGKISGEQSFKGHYDDKNENTPGTFLLKYTLTMTPPKK